MIVHELRHGHGLSADAMLRAYLRHARRGRNGTGALRAWLDRYFRVLGTPESGLEQVVLDAILDAALQPPVAQHWVEVAGRRYRLDFAYPALLLAVEVHGSQHADDPAVVENDLVRIAALRAAGWTVLEIHRKAFATDLAAAIAMLRDCVLPSGGI